MRGESRGWASWRRTVAIARKELRQLLRDRLTLGMILGIPAFQLTIFGYAINLDVRHVPTAVLDRSRTEMSRKLLGELQATQTFDLRRTVADEEEALRLLDAGQISAVIVIPTDFARRLHRGRGVEVAILADATNPTVATAVALSAQGYAHSLASRLQPFVVGGGAPALRLPPGDRQRLGPDPDLVRTQAIRIEVLPFYNPERRTAAFIVPGLIGVILTMTMMLMTALAIVRERERGTFEFLIATPVRRGEVMLGKILPYLVVGHVQVALVLVLGALLFRVPIRGSLVHLGIASLPFLSAMLALGLVVSSLARTQFQATQMSFFFFLPSILLSGFMFPFEAMPRPAQWIGELLPLTHFLRIVRAILLKGASIQVLVGQIAAILAFLVAALLIATISFRKRLA